MSSRWSLRKDEVVSRLQFLSLSTPTVPVCDRHRLAPAAWRAGAECSRHCGSDGAVETLLSQPQGSVGVSVDPVWQ